jgi:hypothetical protein
MLLGKRNDASHSLFVLEAPSVLFTGQLALLRHHLRQLSGQRLGLRRDLFLHFACQSMDYGDKFVDFLMRVVDRKRRSNGRL